MLRFYEAFLPLLAQHEFKAGGWHLPMVTPSRDGNGSWRNLVAYFVTPSAGPAAAPPGTALGGTASTCGAEAGTVGTSSLRLLAQRSFLLVVNYSGCASDGHVSFTRADEDGGNACGRSQGALSSQAYLAGWLTGLAAAGAAVASAAASATAPAVATGAAPSGVATQGLCVTLVDRLAHPSPTPAATCPSGPTTSGSGPGVLDPLAAPPPTAASASAALAEAQAQAQAQAQALSVSSSVTSYGKSSSPPLTESAFRYPVALLRHEGLWLRLPPWGVRAYELLPELQ